MYASLPWCVGKDPNAPTTIPLSNNQLQICGGLEGALSSRYLCWQPQSNHLAVCFSPGGGTGIVL
jgi:hypothetical protein